MPSVSFKCVREVSSEDPIHCANNLLESESVKKWKTKGTGEKLAYVILELEKPAKIIGLDLGNEHSAFIEVQVSRQGCQASDFKDILVTSSFMTPIESKNSAQINRVRCFNTEALASDALQDEWTLVKVVCSQPFNKSVQFGLSFIKVRVAEAAVVPTKIPNKFNISSLIRAVDSSDSDTDDTQKHFNNWRKHRSDESQEELTPKKPKTAEVTRQQTVKREEKTPKVVKEKTKPIAPISRNPSEKLLNSSHSKASPKPKVSPVKKEVVTPKASKLSPAKEIKANVKKQVVTPLKRKSENSFEISKPAAKPRKYRPKSELLKGVTFAISGIQNPLRAELRQKALELGAKYRSDWDNSCTHLICAFKNTPKYNQVHGKGKIVDKEWIDKCYTSKMYIPWRRHALDSKDKATAESDEEIWDEATRKDTETVPAPQAKKPRVSLNDSGKKKEEEEAHFSGKQAKPNTSYADDSEEDTDDEIQRITNKKPAKKDIYDQTTEEEDYIQEKVSRCAKLIETK